MIIKINILWQLNSISPVAESLAVRPESGILFYSLLVTGASLFLEKCLEPGNLLGRYYLLLVYLWRVVWHRKEHHWKRFWLKPFGLCVYCYSAHIAWITFFLFLELHWLYLPLFWGMQYLYLRTFQRLWK